MVTRLLLGLVRWLGLLPLAWLRSIGMLLGWFLYLAVPSRRHVVRTNLRLCFPHLTPGELRKLALQTFVHFAQAWLDRGWLWHGSPTTVRNRLKLTGAVDALQCKEPTVIFAPHFMGLDAAWTALTQQIPRRFVTIYSPQLNSAVDAWILAGRQRFGAPGLEPRLAGAKPIVAAVRSGEPLYLLPDMNFDPRESLWVPFYGISTATVPSLSRFAKLGRAKVVPVVARLTPQGYEIEVMPAWTDFPGDDLSTDTALMNQRLQGYIDTMPTQYYWVHKRFKDRPDGEAPPY
jgi:KDO2-lipid IV(A) lauroyltransferase